MELEYHCQVMLSHFKQLIIMVALLNKAGHYIFILWFLSIYLSIYLLSSSFCSSPDLSGCTLDVYHTSTPGVALVWI